MAEKKPSGFRFRLPWLLPPASPPTREPPTQPPRTTTQTSVASTPAQRPPFRPPGKAPAPPAAPPTIATPAPFSPRRSPPTASTPPQSISPKSSVPQSPTDKTIEPVATQPTKETQAPAETPVPTTSPQTPPFSPPRRAQSQPSPPQTPPPSPSVSPKKSVPKSPIAKTTKPVAPQSAKETQTTTETIQTKETAGPTTLPLSPPLSPHTKAQSQPSPPHITPLPSPSVSPKPSVPKSPIAKNTEPVPDKETQTTTETTSTIETAGPATLLTQAQSQPSPPQTPPPENQSQTRTPPRSPSRLTFVPADKTSLLPSPPTKTTSEISEIKRSTGEKFPVDSNLTLLGNHLALDEKPREITEVRGTQTKSMDSHSPDLKSQKPKLTTATRVPLHKEIKDDISRFIHKTATSSVKQSMDEKHASIITIAGDNKGASMNLALYELKTGNKLNTDTPANDSAINGDGSSRRDSKTSENKEATAIVNSNVQGSNNSMMFNSSVTERNPGVHLGFYRNLANINDSMMKNTESIEMQRAEVNITPPQKLVYDPIIGRSPEGAFMEASECEFEEDEPETSGKGYAIEVI